MTDDPEPTTPQDAENPAPDPDSPLFADDGDVDDDRQDPPTPKKAEGDPAADELDANRATPGDTAEDQ